jgi:hypothetical protein
MATIVARLGQARRRGREVAAPRTRVKPKGERPVWHDIAALYAVIVLTIVLFMLAAFLVTYAATGRAY